MLSDVAIEPSERVEECVPRQLAGATSARVVQISVGGALDVREELGGGDATRPTRRGSASTRSGRPARCLARDLRDALLHLDHVFPFHLPSTRFTKTIAHPKSQDYDGPSFKKHEAGT